MASSAKAAKALLTEAKMSMQELIRFSATEEGKSSPVYVVNTSSKGGAQQKGDILLIINHGAGTDPSIIKIPNSWIPFELTSQVPLADLLNSIHLRRAVSSGLITLIKPDVAESVLNTREGREEAAEQNIASLLLDEKGLRRVIDAGGPNSATAAKILADREKELGKGQQSPEAGITPQLISVVNNETLGERAMLSALRNIEDRLTVADLHYIMAHVDSKKESVLAFARGLMEELGEKEKDSDEE